MIKYIFRMYAARPGQRSPPVVLDLHTRESPSRFLILPKDDSKYLSSIFVQFFTWSHVTSKSLEIRLDCSNGSYCRLSSTCHIDLKRALSTSVSIFLFPDLVDYPEQSESSFSLFPGISLTMKLLLFSLLSFAIIIVIFSASVGAICRIQCRVMDTGDQVLEEHSIWKRILKNIVI